MIARFALDLAGSLARWMFVFALISFAVAAAHAPVVLDNPARHHQEAPR